MNKFRKAMSIATFILMVLSWNTIFALPDARSGSIIGMQKIAYERTVSQYALSALPYVADDKLSENPAVLKMKSMDAMDKCFIVQKTEFSFTLSTSNLLFTANTVTGKNWFLIDNSKSYNQMNIQTHERQRSDGFILKSYQNNKAKIANERSRIGAVYWQNGLMKI